MLYYNRMVTEIKKGKTKLVAHRGLASMERENTLAAFVAAANRPFWGIETDVRMSKDGKFVISHDGNLRRLTGQDAEIANYTYEELQAFTYCDLAGNARADLKVPLLCDYLSICKQYDKIAVVEIKILLNEGSMSALIKEIKREYSLKKTVFISFHLENLVMLRKTLKTQKMQYLASYGGEDGADEWLSGLMQIAVEYDLGLDLDKKYLTKERVERVLAKKIPLNVWTVNKPAVAEEFAAWGVDYITTETCI